MNSYHEIDTIKLEKQKAMQRYRTFNKIANIVRIVELVVAVTFLSYSFSFTSSYFPTIVEFLRAFLRRISSLFFSPHFVFLVGNIIIITLFAKFSIDKSTDNFADEISTEKFIETEISCEKIDSENVGDDQVHAEVAKSTVVEESSVAKSTVVEEREMEAKVYRRTKSTVEVTTEKEEEKKELRRSATEGRRKIVKSPTKNMRRENRRFFEVDELSNEEFNKKVEDFIQKQQKSLREEKLALVLKNID